MTVAELFDQAAQHYDGTRRQLLPCFDDLYGTALQLMPAKMDQNLRILDIGAGTGLLSALIAARYPHADLTLIDLATDMLAKAAERLQPYRERIHIQQLDMTQVRSLGSFDLIVSALAIHHIDDVHKQQLFRDIATMLPLGGRFIHIEQILGPTPAIEQRYEDIWLETVRATGIRAEDLAAAQERMRHDQTVPLASQLAWLTEAGLQEVNCWYQWYRFAVYSGDKA